jgi:hypothetical protein
MARKEDAVRLLREGRPPSEIARQLHTSGPAVMQYLCLKIGEGELRRSDLAFSIPAELRNSIEQAIADSTDLSAGVVLRELRRKGVAANRLDVGVYLNYRRARVVLGDMYELVRALEVRLHSFIKQAFIAEHGEENWWRAGVPDGIRAECAALLEKDPEPAAEPYSYTHLINLREILDKRWPVLSKYMPKELMSKKKDILERMLRLNRIRNSVMHPVRNAALSEEDFEFVREFDAEMRDLTVHMPSETEEVPLAEDIGAPVASHELVSTLTAVPEETSSDTEKQSEEEDPGYEAA